MNKLVAQSELVGELKFENQQLKQLPAPRNEETTNQHEQGPESN